MPDFIESLNPNQEIDAIREERFKLKTLEGWTRGIIEEVKKDTVTILFTYSVDQIRFF